jgi:DNA-binding CsgD family transcriptional regulator
LEIAALLHDLGRVSVPNGIWDKPGPLGEVERARVRDHALQTGRILSFSSAYRDVAQLAASDHERIDGAGYPRGVTGLAVSTASRMLAAADVFQALTEPRAHRAPHSVEAAARVLEAEARGGRLDVQAVGHVLSAVGCNMLPPARWPAGLTDREVDVLRLVTRGLTNKEVAISLDISPRTVQQHTLNIYAKIGVSTRAAAALFASEHELLTRSIDQP